MKNPFKLLANLIAKFFFPPTGTATWARVLPYLVLGILTALVLVGSAYAWDYTNSPGFCGTSCHTMPPEYTAYLTSPHARVDCVDCHIGKGFIATKITRKAGDLKHVFSLLFHTYEFPITAGELRPARETCEQCHFPEKFSEDSLQVIQRYANDDDNSPVTNYLIMKTGGGSKRLGQGRGIHWHIVNNVYFYPTDKSEQVIPYIKVVEDDGSITEWLDVESDVKIEDIKPEELVQMDCITCHNRITHLVPMPEDTVDALIARGQISPNIPEIRKKSLEAYSQIFKTVDEGLKNIANIKNYYQSNYEDYYVVNSEKIDEAVAALQQAYQASVYPEQNSSWNSHPNNVGHKDFPGCLRCHDGKHLNQNQDAIRLECNLCHSIPTIAGRQDFVTKIEISRGPEPESHLNANWISLHRQIVDASCQNCHTTGNAGGTDNSSFCSNSACHGSSWKYAGFDAPALREILAAQLPPTPTPMPLPAAGSAVTYSAVIGPILTARCSGCHGETGMKGLTLTTFQGLMKGSESGPVIISGNAQGSRLVQIQSQAHFGQLTPAELNLVIEWINAGAPE